MAKEKQNPEEEQSIQDRLELLCKLQETLSEIDKIRTLRGELPLEVKDLEDEIVGLETRLLNYSASAKALNQSVAAEKIKITTAKEQAEKFKSRLNEVRSNREYDNLAREIEFQELEAQLAEKRAKEYATEMSARKSDISKLKELLKERKEVYEEKKSDLDRIVAETRVDEEQLREKAQQIEKKIEPRLLNAFKRIRKNAFNGMAIVPVDRQACGGCFNQIPPQRLLDIKLGKKIIVCEYCGRILVDSEENQDEEATTATPTKKKAAKK